MRKNFDVENEAREVGNGDVILLENRARRVVLTILQQRQVTLFGASGSTLPSPHLALSAKPLIHFSLRPSTGDSGFDASDYGRQDGGVTAGRPQIPHEFSFDPAYGFSLKDLRAIRHTGEEPDNFDVFWSGLRQKADRHPREVSFREFSSPRAGMRLIEARYAVWPGYRVGAWVRLPENPADVCGVRVVGHGYSGRESPDEEPANPRHLTIFPVAPGFGISRNPGIPSDSAALHVVHGIENPEAYILGSCVSALWGALDVVEVLLERPVTGAHYAGWSFGGGLGALMLPWDPRFSSAELGQPTFGNHPFRLSVPCVGSGESVRQKFLRDPGIAQTLTYYDAAFAARRLRIPVVFACARFDPAVPPPGQFTVANECGSLKFISEFLVGHFDFHHPAEADESDRHRKNLEQMQRALAVPATAPPLL